MDRTGSQLFSVLHFQWRGLDKQLVIDQLVIDGCFVQFVMIGAEGFFQRLRDCFAVEALTQL
jgi:hypothetical protein